jgi:hypothetical protein
MHFTRLELWAAYFLLVGLMLTSWTLWKNRERIRDWRNRYDSWDAADPEVYDIADDDDEPEVHHERPAGQDATGDVTPVITGPGKGLPDADTRTMRLQQLADPCSTCGGDHPGDCPELGSPYGSRDKRWNAITDADIPVLEGTIVARAEVILAETRREWTWVLGQWLPPSDALDGLETGSWLRDLLVSA